MSPARERTTVLRVLVSELIAYGMSVAESKIDERDSLDSLVKTTCLSCDETRSSGEYEPRIECARAASLERKNPVSHQPVPMAIASTLTLTFSPEFMLF